MTTEPRRALAALALVPATAGVFAGSVAWAAEHGPGDVAANGAAGEPVGYASPAAVGADPSAAVITEQLDALTARIAALQAELDARSAQAATSDAAPRAAAAQRAQASAPARPVDTTTRASG